MENILSNLRTLAPDWHTPRALVAAIVSALTAASLLLSYLEPHWHWHVVTWVICAATIGVAWYLPRRVPRAIRGRVGIALALAAEDSTTATTRADFVESLRRSLEGSAVRAAFDVVEVQEWRARAIVDLTRADRLRRSCRAHFIFFGSVRRRTVNGEGTSTIQLRGMVSHVPLPQLQGEQLRQEFTKILPHQVLLDPKNELLATEFTSRWAGVVAKYVIALAAAMSGDLRYAEALLLEVRSVLPERDAEFQVFKHIREQTPKWLTQIYIAQSTPIYDAWILSRRAEQMDQLHALAAKVEQNGCDRTPFLPLLAICAFVRKRDVKSAIALLNEANSRDPVHLISLGFLHAYAGDLKRATQLYRRASRNGVAPGTIVGQVEPFQDWVLEQEPDRYQLYFSLGFLNLHLKGDDAAAARDFQRFLQSCPSTKYANEKKLIAEWLPSITAKTVVE